MPLDDTSSPDRREPPPEMDRDGIAAQLQKQLGRVLTWPEYVKVWNAVTEQMDPAGVRSDYLTGERDVC